MLQIDEISRLISEDSSSERKRFARAGQNYYEGKHDILNYRLFYYNADGNLVEDKYRSNVRISHPFFTEIVDQAVQYILSGGSFVKSDDPELQAYLDEYFDDSFMAEISDTITDAMSKGFAYMYAYKNADYKTTFQNANSIGVVEVEARFASDNQDHILYWYVDRIDRENKRIKKIQDWTATETYFYTQYEEGKITADETAVFNPAPHTVINQNGVQYAESFGFVPFFRLDNNRNRVSGLATIKDLIDDYDLMASSLSNNLIDFDTPIHVVRGFQGDNLDELFTNVKTKKMIGVDEGGGMEIQTVDIPFQARQAKLELDEKNIYRFGFGLNTSGLKDTNATTNIAIKSAYSLLDLKASKFEIKLKQFMSKLLDVVLEEINEQNQTGYQKKQVYFEFEHEVMSNAQENAQIGLTEAQTRQAEINTILALSDKLDNETLMQLVCEQLDIDYTEVKNKLPDPEESEKQIQALQRTLEPEGNPEAGQGMEPNEPEEGSGNGLKV